MRAAAATVLDFDDSLSFSKLGEGGVSSNLIGSNVLAGAAGSVLISRGLREGEEEKHRIVFWK